MALAAASKSLCLRSGAVCALGASRAPPLGPRAARPKGGLPGRFPQVGAEPARRLQRRLTYPTPGHLTFRRTDTGRRWLGSFAGEASPETSGPCMVGNAAGDPGASPRPPPRRPDDSPEAPLRRLVAPEVEPSDAAAYTHSIFRPPGPVPARAGGGGLYGGGEGATRGGAAGAGGETRRRRRPRAPPPPRGGSSAWRSARGGARAEVAHARRPAVAGPARPRVAALHQQPQRVRERELRGDRRRGGLDAVARRGAHDAAREADAAQRPEDGRRVLRRPHVRELARDVDPHQLRAGEGVEGAAHGAAAARGAHHVGHANQQRRRRRARRRRRPRGHGRAGADAAAKARIATSAA